MSRDPGPEFAGIIAYLRETFGLDPHRGGMIRTLIRHQEARKQALALDAAAFLRQVERDPEERARLVQAMTVNHSWFFRDPKQLESLSERMGELHRSSTSRPLEIWIAGCATGQEAWTVAMIATQQSLPVRILATDIDRSALAEAKRGEYGRWSLRELPQPLWAYLEQLSGERWRVRDELRPLVRFEEHNLCDPCPAQQFDVISCRNVLIYFEGDHAREAVDRMRAQLRPAGELVLGAGDLMFQPRVSDLSLEAARALRDRRRVATPPTSSPAKTPTISKRPPAPVRSRGRISASFVAPTFTPSAPKPEPKPPSPSDSARARIAEVLAKPPTLKNDPVQRELDRAGREVSSGIYEEAVEVLELLISEDPLLAEAHLWVGIAYHSRGEDRRAGEALRRARCLEPELWPGTLFAALSAERRGRWEAAARCWAELDRLMNTPDAPSIEGTPSLLSALPTWRAEAAALARQRNSASNRGTLKPTPDSKS